MDSISTSESLGSAARKDDALVQVSRILAIGVLRLRARLALNATVLAPTDSRLASLEVSPETVLSVHTG
jgi:hypothetical protein